jgi:hypothetical protein
MKTRPLKLSTVYTGPPWQPPFDSDTADVAIPGGHVFFYLTLSRRALITLGYAGTTEASVTRPGADVHR